MTGPLPKFVHPESSLAMLDLLLGLQIRCTNAKGYRANPWNDEGRGSVGQRAGPLCQRVASWRREH
jgi:hypothetical protein